MDFTPDYQPRPAFPDHKLNDEVAALRAKSALRLKYEAETEVIRRKIGDLEAIRSQLGLSQRKMAQLLMVDPSAWTRWTKGGENVPPHIYRMLTWYLALEEKYPALDVNFWLNTVAQVTDNARIPAIESHSKKMEAQLNATTDRLITATDEISTVEKRLSLFERNLPSQVSENLAASFLKTVKSEMDMRERRTRSFITWSVVGISLAAISMAGLALLMLR